MTWMPWKRFTVAGAVALAMVSAIGAQAAVERQSAPTKPTLTIGMITTPITLDPAKDGSGPWNTVRYLAYEGLTRAHPNG
jgi:ABC-type transport system substrate-binding protein